MPIIGANNPKRDYQFEYHAEGCRHLRFLEKPLATHKWETIEQAESVWGIDDPPRIIAPCARRAD